jgi:hypothetical protein
MASGAASGATYGRLDPDVQYWQAEIDDYERLTDKWLRRGRKIIKRYKDIRSPREEAITRFNVFWANVQIRLPALYARNPKAVVERRFRDRDPIGRVTSEVLERSIQFTLESVNDAKLINRQAILDFELVGRGTTWVRYVPHFRHKPAKEAPEPGQQGDQAPPPQPPEESTGPSLGGASTVPVEGGHAPADELAASGPQVTTDADSEEAEDEIDHEEVKLDFVAWDDFGHSWARTWDEVRAVWRKVYLDRKELRERFCKPGGLLTESEVLQIPLDYAPRSLNDARVPITRKKAVVYEIWDKGEGKVLWFVRNFPSLLDERDDPEHLKDFFPCPRPLLANLANDELIPVPNLVHYQDQANEIDELSSRITSITKCLKVAGVRDTSAEGLDRLLAEGIENQLVPVEGWAIHKEKGGLKGVYELLPMEEIATTLGFLREQRKELIDDVYQLTGISDIVRGLSDPSETATAQQLKGRFSVLRIQDAQEDVQRFCRQQVHIVGEMLSKFDIETLKNISGVKLLTAKEKALLQWQLAQQAAAAQAAAPPPPGPGAAPQAGPGPGPAGAPGGPGAPAPGGPAPPGPPGQPAGMPPGAGPGAPAGAHPLAAGPPTPGLTPGQAAPMGGGMNPSAPPMAQTPAPGQAPISPDKLSLLELPTWEDVEALLRNPVTREFRLDIETDSTIRMDEEAEKKARMELLTTVGDYMTQAMTAGAQAPEIVPMLAELLMFGIRAFTTARSVEQTFEDMMAALEQASKQPRPDPEQAKMQIEAQTKLAIAHGEAQIRAQSDQQRTQLESQANAAREQAESQRQERADALAVQLDQHKAAIKAHLDQTLQESKQHFEAQKSQFEAHSKERLAMLEHHLNMVAQRHQQAHDQRMGAAGAIAQGGRQGRNGKQQQGRKAA